MKSLGEITPYEKNAKKHDETQINNVAESIRQYGFVQHSERSPNEVRENGNQKDGGRAYGKTKKGKN